jgi:protoporphyrinogen oxidase
MNTKRTSIIIGAGPAGLTAAYEMLKRTDIKPVILEKSGDIGGISKTINYKGNRMDIGGHRFFSKSDRVMDWWLNILPLEKGGKKGDIHYQNKSRVIVQRDMQKNQVEDPENQAERLGNQSGTRGCEETDKVMLVRRRLSRIYFLRKFFAYPISLSVDTLWKLGVIRAIAILVSYLWAQVFPKRPERSLEDFMINRFGKTLYRLFFRDYTEKVWGVPCDQIPAEWGAQRIKGVSISKAIEHAVKELTKKKAKAVTEESDISRDAAARENITRENVAQKETETSLIEQFFYPKYGPGQLWEEVARQVQEMGGVIYMQHDVKKVHVDGEKVVAVTAVNAQTGEELYLKGDYFFSTMPVKELIADIEAAGASSTESILGHGNANVKGIVPEDVKAIASGLQYRDFITVGILLRRLSYLKKDTGEWKPLQLQDTWIYIQEKDVKVGRLQIFNNWSPYMVKDPDTVWVGMEFFCNETDDFWKLPDSEIAAQAIKELEKIGLATEQNVLDSTVLRVEKTYPAYFGAYEHFDKVRAYTDTLENLFLVGRNGMHKYNNADHSMLTAMVAVDNIIAGVTSKENIWAINTEQEYHGEKVTDKQDVYNTSEDGGMAAAANEVAQEEMAKSGIYASRPSAQPSKVKAYGSSFGGEEGIDTFKDFLFKKNKVMLWFAGIAAFILFIVFKHFYPSAGFIDGDSYVYLETAYGNYSINTYPIGYSKFLRLFSVMTIWDTALVFFQYAILQCSSLFLVFTLAYLYKPAKFTFVLLYACMLFNPVFLYMANYVSSDALFLSLSLTWFATLLWIIHHPDRRLIAAHALLILLAFTVRYNALFYPVIAILGFVLSKQSWQRKLVGIAAGFVLIGGFMWHTSNQYKRLTGIRQFSPFSGWQMANNALYAYRFTQDQPIKNLPEKFKKLDKGVRMYFDTTHNYFVHVQESLVASTFYMWDPKSPLQVYMEDGFKRDSTATQLKKWASYGPLFEEYGKFLIKQYPAAFAKYYLVPNLLKYYAPPVEFLEMYNMGKDSISNMGRIWFGYRSPVLKKHYKDLKVTALDFYPILVGVFNVVFIFSLMAFAFLQGFKHNKPLSQALLLAAGLWLVNFGFSVFASQIALRFQMLPILVFWCFGWLLIDYIWRVAFGTVEVVKGSGVTGRNWAVGASGIPNVNDVAKENTSRNEAISETGAAVNASNNVSAGEEDKVHKDSQ